MGRDRGRDQPDERGKHDGVATVKARGRGGSLNVTTTHATKQEHRKAAPRHRLERRSAVTLGTAGDPTTSEPSSQRFSCLRQRLSRAPGACHRPPGGAADAPASIHGWTVKFDPRADDAGLGLARSLAAMITNSLDAAVAQRRAAHRQGDAMAPSRAGSRVAGCPCRRPDQGLRQAGDATVRALDGVSVELERGGFTAVMGPSGSGKSTLMHCMAGLDRAHRGRAFIGDQELERIGRLGPDRAAARPRWLHLPVVQPRPDAVPRPRTSRCRPIWPAPRSTARGSTIWSTSSASPAGCSHRPSELSGGQQQRVACARALIGRPELIFADEPTGNLDSNASAEVLGFLRDAVNDHGQSIVMVTHDPLAAAYADRVVFLADGQVGRRDPLALGRRRARAHEAAGELTCAGSRSEACWPASCAWR